MTDTIRLTYRELAERLGIEPDSARIKARRLAKSGRWKLIPGNHPGAASTVEVPAADLVREGDPGRTPPGAPVQQIGGSAPGRPDADVPALEDHIKSLTARLEVADRQTDQLRADHAAELERIRGELERTRQDADRQDRLHREQRTEVEHLLKALVERVEADQARLIEERDHLRNDLQEARAEADHAKSDQVRMAQDVAGMFDELRAVADRHAELHADRARLEAELERTRQDTDRHANHAADLEQVRDELDRARQDASLWREEADRERARIANLQADAQHTEREMARLRTEIEQARRPWWRRLWGPEP
jgi:chromosome segregation ATPase